MTYILDACALLAFLNEETGKGYETVRGLLDRAVTGKVTLYMSLVNLVEVHYRFIQLKGNEIADAAMGPVKSLPVMFISNISGEIYCETARFKAGYSISLADAFLCATAKSLAATIVTKDKEIKPVEENEALSVLWI